jgi:hypothetical protein
LLYNNGTISALSSTYGSTGSYLPLTFLTSDTERMRIDSSGNVGIGTTPSDKLDVNGTIRITSGNTVRWVDAGTVRVSIQGDTSSNAIFSTAGSERMRIDSSGNVGIGASSLSTLFTVNGINNTVRFSGASTSNATYATFFNNSANQLYFGIENSSGGGIIGTGVAYGTVLSTVSTTPLAFGTNSTERMRISAAGNVSIGNTNNVVALDVTGNIRGSSSTTASGSTITPTSDTTNQYTVTALAVPATIAIPSGTPIDGQKLTLRIKDNGTARALTWNTSAGGYRVIGTTLPTTTTASKVVYIGCIYNSQDSFWDVVAVGQQA